MNSHNPMGHRLASPRPPGTRCRVLVAVAGLALIPITGCKVGPDYSASSGRGRERCVDGPAGKRGAAQSEANVRLVGELRTIRR